jgi:hypothetical protein
MTAPAACDHEGARDARGFAASGHGLRGYAFTVGGVEVMLMPSEARAQGVPLRTLNAEQAATLDALGETLVPGAKQAGITNFVDQQISGPAEEALLEARPAPCRVGLVRSSARMDRLGAAQHTHAGVEEVHLLDGELWIDERKLVPGDYNYGAPGAGDERVWSETGCTCVLVTSTKDTLR